MQSHNQEPLLANLVNRGPHLELAETVGQNPATTAPRPRPPRPCEKALDVTPMQPVELPRRLRKVLRDRTDLSLKLIDAIIARGEVTINGLPAPSWGEVMVFPSDEVLINAQPLPDPKKSRVFLLFKPINVTTTASDPRGKRDLSAWLSQLPPGVFPIGRLDRETTGALLLTNDGNLATALLSPEHRANKVYWLWLNECIEKDDPRLQRWLTGIPMLGEIAHASQVEVLRHTPDFTELLVTLHEGKNRQIRRMSRASDFRLLHLHRKSICSVSLDAMSPGQLRELNDQEIEQLWSDVGGKHVVFEKQWEALKRHASLARQNGAPNRRLDNWLDENCVQAESALGATS